MTYPEPINAHDCVYPIEANCQDGMILGFEDGVWKFMSPESFKLRQLKWWLRVPPKPLEDVPDWYKAWEQRFGGHDIINSGLSITDTAKMGFRAGYEAGRKAKA